MRRIGGLVISRAACSVLPSTRRQTRGGIPVRHQIEESGNDSKKFRGQIALTQESARWRVRRFEGGSVAAFSTLGCSNQLGSGATAGPCRSALVDLSALGPTWLVGWSSGQMESHWYSFRQCWTCDHRVGARSAFRLCGARLGARDDAELLAGAWAVPLHAQPDVRCGYRDMVRLDRVLWKRRGACGTRGHLDRGGIRSGSVRGAPSGTAMGRRLPRIPEASAALDRQQGGVLQPTLPFFPRPERKNRVSGEATPGTRVDSKGSRRFKSPSFRQPVRDFLSDSSNSRIFAFKRIGL